MDELTLFCPAKINLFLAITGRRSDGFHDLISVVSPLDWGDILRVTRRKEGEFTLSCDDPAVPSDESNLVLKAARAFAGQTGWTGGAHFHLNKVVPMGAGLGGGSSDAVGALKAMNELAGQPLDLEGLSTVAASVGSDCPLFLRDRAVVMRGRGDEIEPVVGAQRKRLSAERILLIKPAFGVNTGWAYGALAEKAPEGYLPKDEAESRLTAWLGDAESELDQLAFNSMEEAVWAKNVALPTLAKRLRKTCGVELHMSGSGSACFVILTAGSDFKAIESVVHDCWGETALVQPVALEA